ncbi:DUF1398 domain-containing protein [Bdellovibrio sp. HCB209]|uniref:DUF1398 domain-containing protein n=1 Tax=Bdellovibrio sp. HCB209 TaxID=3394354 RepID=UPI0039B53F16
MSQLVNQLLEAQKFAFSIRPKAGGFPVLAEVLRQAGVKTNRWELPSCQSVYVMEGGSVVQQGTPLVSGVFEVPKFNQEALILALRKDQAGQGSFPEFLKSSWEAGVVAYDVDFADRKVIYYGVNGESYTEEYPHVEVKR